MKKYEFIPLYDAAPEFSLKGMDLEEMYKVLGLDSSRGCARHKVYDTLRERIFDLINVKSKEAPHISYTELQQYKEYWFYQDKINDTTIYEPYIFAITQLNYSYGHELKYLIPYSETGKWIEAMRLLKCLMEDGRNLHHDVKITMERQTNRAMAIKRLMRQGVRVQFNEEKKEVELGDLFPIHRKISATIEKVGGARSAEAFLQIFTDYSENHHRFTQKRQGNRMGIVKHEPDLPIAYLINLAFNKLSYKGNERYMKELKDAVQLAIDVCAASYDVQTYTIWEDIFYNKEKIDDYFRQLVIWDSLYTIPQSSTVFVKDLMAHLLSEFEQLGFEMSDVYTLKDYARVMEYMMGKTQIHEFTQIRFADVHRELGMEDEKLRAIWNDVAVKAVNAGYITPHDYMHIKVLFNPAFQMHNGDMLLYPASLGAMGWYEVMATKLRKKDKKSDDKIGPFLESFLHQRFAQKGILSKTGDYDVEGVHGECDVAIEGEKQLLLMELKKKPLTRRAKEGHTFQIIVDLAEALFCPQEQAFKTETLLMENGRLELKKDGRIEMLEKGDRRIEKLAVALNDFGALHERAILEKVLDIFWRYSITFEKQEIADFLGNAVATKGVMKGLDELRDIQEEMRDYIKRLLTFYPSDKPYRVFFNSGFFSIEQIYFLLSISSSTEEFIENIMGLKYVTFGTKDFWAEVDMKLNMQSEKQRDE